MGGLQIRKRLSLSEFRKFARLHLVPKMVPRLEMSHSGRVRSLGKRVGCKPSRVRISPSPQGATLLVKNCNRTAYFVLMSASVHTDLILAADDYGIRESTRPILDLARAGILQRVGVLVHFTTPEEARDLLETGVKIDIHLEMIDLLKSGHKTKDSAILRGLNFSWRYALGRLHARQVEAQWRAQILRFQELFGRFPDGLNSHEHLHYFPAFFQVYLRLAEEFHIPFVRFGRRGILSISRLNVVGQVLTALWQRDQRYFREGAFDTTDFLVSFDWLAHDVSRLKTLPVGTVEVVVHPERTEEYEVLKNYR